VDDTLLVRCGQSLDQLQPQPRALFLRQSVIGDSLAQRHPGHVLHHQKVDLLLRIKIVDGGDVGMVQLGQRQGFRAEIFAGGVVGERLGWQYLDGYVAVEVLIAGAIDFAHAASADPLDDVVVAQPETDE
jgi:hypothetical protein